jgi:hypothetical protein
MAQEVYADVVNRNNTFSMEHAASVLYKAGSITNDALNGSAAIARAKIAQEIATHPVAFEQMRVWDNPSALLPGTAAADDLGLIPGTLGTSHFVLQTSDAKATTVTQYARFTYVVPDNYDDGQSIDLRASCQMVTTISDGTATLDVQAFKWTRISNAVASDICSTAATTINSLTAADVEFTITPTTVTAGDLLDIRLTIAITDTATGTAVIGQINSVDFQIDVRG